MTATVVTPSRYADEPAKTLVTPPCYDASNGAADLAPCTFLGDSSAVVFHNTPAQSGDPIYSSTRVNLAVGQLIPGQAYLPWL